MPRFVSRPGRSAFAAPRSVSSLVILASLLALLMPTVACVPTTATGSAVVGDSVLHLSDAGPITLDPAISGEMSSHTYVMQLYGGLVRLDAELQIVPDIADSWTISEDGTRYVFELREDVKFHSGKGVTAGAFKYSWERACDPDTGSLTAPTYLGDIVGAEDMLSGAATSLAGVAVLDDYTLQVDIEEPRAYFIDKLTYPTTYVVDEETVSAGQDWWRQPNGTGPFEMVSWEEGSSMVLGRYDNYHGDLALVDAVEFHILAGVPMSLYEQGVIDVVGVGSAYMSQVTDPTNPFSLEHAWAPELSLYYVGFDVTKEPFDDVKVRRAFCHAVDRQRIVDVLFEGSVQVASGVLPAGLPGYDPSLVAFEYDPVLARQLLSESSYGSAAALPPMELTISGYANQVPAYLAAAIADWRKNLGVEVGVRQLEPEVFLYELYEERDELFSMGWIADYPNPQNFLGTLFGTGESTNIAHYSNSALDDLLDRAAAEQDEQVRLELYQEAERLVVDEAPCLPLMYGSNHVLVRPYVSGYRLSPLGVPDLSTVSVDRP